MYEFILAATLIFTSNGEDRVRVAVSGSFPTQAQCQARVDEERRKAERQGLRYFNTTGTVCASRRIY